MRRNDNKCWDTGADNCEYPVRLYTPLCDRRVGNLLLKCLGLPTNQCQNSSQWCQGSKDGVLPGRAVSWYQTGRTEYRHRGFTLQSSHRIQTRSIHTAEYPPNTDMEYSHRRVATEHRREVFTPHSGHWIQTGSICTAEWPPNTDTEY